MHWDSNQTSVNWIALEDRGGCTRTWIYVFTINVCHSGISHSHISLTTKPNRKNSMQNNKLKLKYPVNTHGFHSRPRRCRSLLLLHHLQFQLFKKPNRYHPYGVGARGHGESFPGKLRENAWYGWKSDLSLMVPIILLWTVFWQP